MSELFTNFVRRLGNPQISGLILAMILAVGGIAFLAKPSPPTLQH